MDHVVSVNVTSEAIYTITHNQRKVDRLQIRRTPAPRVCITGQRGAADTERKNSLEGMA
jgi:hypothetical protein